MSLNDPLANAMSKIMNAERVHKTECTIENASKTVKAVLAVLHENMYLGESKEMTSTRGTTLLVHLLGSINKCGAIKPRFSVKKDQIEKFEKRYLLAKDFGILILSTSQGIMTHLQAKKKNIGGKLLAYVY